MTARLLPTRSDSSDEGGIEDDATGEDAREVDEGEEGEGGRRDAASADG